MWPVLQSLPTTGGFAATAPKGPTPTPLVVGQYTLVGPPMAVFGYLLVTVDLSAPPGKLTIAFNAHDRAATHDSVTVDLTTGRLVA